jgi:hypothetical protein
MALITNYSTLQANVIEWLNRAGDAELIAAVPTMIQLAEGQLRRDERVRDLVFDAAFSITADDQAMPSGIDHIESWYHDGGIYFGEIETVPLERLSILKTRHGVSGVPRFAALIPSETAGTFTVRFAPVPSGTYTTVLSYKPLLVALGVGNPTNWLLLSHPDIYLYATLVESAPYLKDDPRLATWHGELEMRLEALHRQIERQRFSGTQRRRPRFVIGA